MNAYAEVCIANAFYTLIDYFDIYISSFILFLVYDLVVH